jgi:hypothetical protein
MTALTTPTKRLHTSHDKDKDDTKMDATAHFRLRPDLNTNRPTDFKCTPVQLKNYMMLNNTKHVILTTNI